MVKCVIAFIIILIIILIIIIVFLYHKNSDLQKKNASIILQAQRDVYTANVKAQSEIAAAHKDCDQEVKELKISHADEIRSLVQDYENQIQQVRENIESSKETLSMMDEKELLVNVMLALDGYSGRFERLEEYLKDEQITEKISRMSQDVTAKINIVAGNLAKQVTDMNYTIRKRLNETDFNKRMDSVSSDLRSIRTDLDRMRSDIESIQWNMGDDYSSDLSDIKSEISSLQSTVDSIDSRLR